jgi:hypothetical protein
VLGVAEPGMAMESGETAVPGRVCKRLKGMAGTTRLELATSAVRGSVVRFYNGLQDTRGLANYA